MTPLQELSIAQRNAKNYLVWKDILKEYTNPRTKTNKAAPAKNVHDNKSQQLSNCEFINRQNHRRLVPHRYNTRIQTQKYTSQRKELKYLILLQN